MRSIGRRLGVLAAISFAGVALNGCGGSSETIAQVAGVGAISKATLEHWIAIEAVLVYEELPSKPIPRGVVPDPPDYAACIAYLKTARQTIAETAPKATTTVELKSKCAQKYHGVKEYALNTLINWEWTIGNGRAAGMKVSDREARRRLQSLQASTFPKPGEFELYLKRTRETIPDMLYRAKIQLFELKLQEKLTDALKTLPAKPSAQQQQHVLANVAKGWPTQKEWVTKTSCNPGYVTSDCKQYHGPLSPGTPN